MRMPVEVVIELIELGVLDPTQDDTALKMSFHKDGKEYPNPKPMVMKVGFRKPETLAEEVARIMKSSRMMQKIYEEGYETIDDASDFEMDDDLPPLTPYEVQSMQPEYYEGVESETPVKGNEAPAGSPENPGAPVVEEPKK